MRNKEIPAGVVHSLPPDLRTTIAADNTICDLWRNLTPLARNEWICWIEDAKKPETRQKRIKRFTEELKDNKKRPCCWPGCPHRTKERRND